MLPFPMLSRLSLRFLPVVPSSSSRRRLACTRLPVPALLSPLFAALADRPLRTTKHATLSLLAATLTSRVKHNPFVCHSYRKHPGWGHTLQSKFFSFCHPTTRHSLFSAISFTIRTYGKHVRNPFGIRTSKTQDLKPFRIRTYEKTGEGVPRPVSLLCAGSAYSASQRYLCPSSFAVGCKLSTFDSSPRLYRRRNAAKMNNSSSPHGHAV